MSYGLTRLLVPARLMQFSEQPGDSSPGNSADPGSVHPEPPALSPKEPDAGIPWRVTDITGGIGISITAAAALLIGGLAVDGITGNESGSSIAAAIAVTLTALTLSLLIAKLTHLPLTPTFTILGFATSANAFVHMLATDETLIGLSIALIEQALTSSVPFGVAWLFVNRKYGRSIRDIGFLKPATSRAYLIGIASWFVAVQAVNLWQFLVQGFKFAATPDNTTPVLDIAGGSIVIAWLLAGLLVPFTEEVFFRGFILRGLRSKTGHWPAILLSSGVFAVFHIDPGLYVPTFLLGVAFAWVSLKTRSLWPTIMTHSLQNTLSLLLAAGLFS
jgi:membrane protease YdiL (CAAX protease family)